MLGICRYLIFSSWWHDNEICELYKETLFFLQRIQKQSTEILRERELKTENYDLLDLETSFFWNKALIEEFSTNLGSINPNKIVCLHKRV